MIQEGEDARSLVAELKHEVLEESNKLQENNRGILLEETGLTNQISENMPKKLCIGNICTVAPLEEAVEYLIDQVVQDTSIPKVKVKAL
jgi:Lhr-like helicase